MTKVLHWLINLAVRLRPGRIAPKCADRDLILGSIVIARLRLVEMTDRPKL